MSDWRRRSEFNLINIYGLGTVTVDMICIPILLCSADAFPLPRHTKTTKPKYQRIIADDFVDGLRVHWCDLVFNWFGIVTQARRRHDDHVCHARFNQKLRKLVQLRVGQLLPLSGLYFHPFIYCCRRALLNVHNQNTRQLAWFETEWKVLFRSPHGRDIFRFSFLLSRWILTALSPNPKTLTTRACLNTLIESQWWESRKFWAGYYRRGHSEH